MIVQAKITFIHIKMITNYIIFHRNCKYVDHPINQNCLWLPLPLLFVHSYKTLTVSGCVLSGINENSHAHTGINENSHAINRTPWVLSSELFTARTKITLRPAPGVHFWIKQANHLHSCAQSRIKARPFRKGWNTWNRTSWGLSARTFLRPMGVLPPKGSCDSTHKRHKQTVGRFHVSFFGKHRWNQSFCTFTYVNSTLLYTWCYSIIPEPKAQTDTSPRNCGCRLPSNS